MKLMTKSSTEAELVAASDGGTQVIWSREFLLAQGENIEESTIYQDNMSTIALLEKGKPSSNRTKHVNIRYFWINDRINNGDIKIKYKKTEDMVADILTKPLQGEKFRFFRDKLLNWKY